MSRKIAFNTANLVARVSGYRFELKNWGQQHEKTARETDAEAFKQICAEIKQAGYDAVELWVAHADPTVIDERQARDRKKIADDHGLKLIGLAAQLTPANVKLCQWMGIDTINGGLWGMEPKTARELTRSSGIRFNFENHPEKSAQEIAQKIDGGDDLVGVAVDTGWLGTQGVDAPSCIRELGPLVRHVHVKDVKHAGGHETCPLGQGVVDLEGTFRDLKAMNYTGWFAWEDEPEDRNPMSIAAEMRKWIEQRV